MEKGGPDTVAGDLLWKKYRDQLVATQHIAHSVGGDPLFLHSVMLPSTKTMVHFLPEQKIVAKINLQDMVLPVPDSSPAYPDPLLLTYKSSINWTRKYAFQMMAEAEPQEEDVLHPNGPVPQQILVDGGSKASIDGSSIPEADV